MNSVLNNLKVLNNTKLTENGAVARESTLSAVYDMFAFGGAYRNRTDGDCILLFKNALEENTELALKCLFYLGDCRGGQGERRFFRVCFNWLAENHRDLATRNLCYVPFYRRWDDVLVTTAGTPLENDALYLVKQQLVKDIQTKHPSLLAKWLPSENASSERTKKLGNLVRKYLNMSHKEYRKTLSALRERIKVVEKLMSAGRWDEIEFDKIPSKAGLIYKDAFSRRDMIADKYKEFIEDDDTKVNADTLYPYEIVREVLNTYRNGDELREKTLEKYWNNLPDYLDGKDCKMICMCDTSGSMTWSNRGNVRPIDVAISLSMYCAERLGGAFKDYFITFSRDPKLVKFEGTDFCDKVYRVYHKSINENTDLLKAFKMLKAATKAAKPEDRLETVVIISDMEIDQGYGHYNPLGIEDHSLATEMEKVRIEWAEDGLTMPRLIYWNVNARNQTILDFGPNVSYVSGASPILFEQVLTGKSGMDLMLNKLVESKRYDCIH